MPRRKAVNEMKKLYEKNELLFAILWIVVYCAASIPIRGSLGDESLAMVIKLGVIAAGILVFVKKFSLEEKYGLVKWNGSAANYLFFLPVLILMTGNLWGESAPPMAERRRCLRSSPCFWSGLSRNWFSEDFCSVPF